MAQIFYCDLNRWTPMPDNSRYRNKMSNMEGFLSHNIYDNCLNDNGNILGFTGEPPTDYYVGIQICPGELILPLNFARLILNSEFPDTLDRSKVALTMVRVTYTDHNLRIEILQTRELCLLLMREIDWIIDHISA